jgi:hypothetical protein
MTLILVCIDPVSLLPYITANRVSLILSQIVRFKITVRIWNINLSLSKTHNSVVWTFCQRCENRLSIEIQAKVNLCVSSMAAKRALPWFRWLVVGISRRRTRFAPGSIHVGFVVDKVALGQAFHPFLRFSPVSIIPPPFSILVIRGMTNMSVSGNSSETYSQPIEI